MPWPTFSSRCVFFTGKGGVGKTSCACATAIQLADAGKRVLLVSTDPASNLDEVLHVSLNSTGRSVPDVPRLFALNINPEEAAFQYRERVVGPYRGVLPQSAITSMEEQLSGACTTEIAAYNEFAKLLGDASITSNYDYLVFDTAPTGHTLRLLELPAAWSHFMDNNVGGTSCLGPLSGLQAQRALYAAAHKALCDAAQTTIALVARLDTSSLKEAARTYEELRDLGVSSAVLMINGVFRASDRQDEIARMMEKHGQSVREHLPESLAALETFEISLQPFELLGPNALRHWIKESGSFSHSLEVRPLDEPSFAKSLEALLPRLAESSHGVIMTMGKGGVGKTSVATQIAWSLAQRGLSVTLTTTDPAAHVSEAIKMLGNKPESLKVTRIDPKLESAKYREEVMRTAGKDLDAQGRALLEEELRSPCAEEIAVFRAFADTVAEAVSRIVVIDTAPTGHSLLLLDAAESYHREVLKRPSGSPESVINLLPRLRDPNYTRILLVTLPEATPVHEALQLERELVRANIPVFAWVFNQCFANLNVRDPLLLQKKAREFRYIHEVQKSHEHVFLQSFTSHSISKLI